MTLAFGAEVRATLRYDDAANRCAADYAGLPRPAIDLV